MYPLRFMLMYLLTIPHMVGLLLGGWALLLGPASFIVILCLGEAFSGDDRSVPTEVSPTFLNGMLYLALPLVMLVSLLTIRLVIPGDLFGISAMINPLLKSLVSADLLTVHSQSNLLAIMVAFLGSGLLIAALGTIVGHELIHRPWGSLSHRIGRVLLAFSWDSNFAIEHIYGHHRYLGSPIDPATAPRGRNVYSHIVLSTIGGYRSAWNLEVKRLHTSKKVIISRHNRFLHGIALSLIVSALSWLVGGWRGLLAFTVVALIAKAYLEIVNYMEHYGLVRDPSLPVKPHHSWNSNNAFSSWATFNLTRHSHHHARPVPFWRLEPMPDTPMMPAGYMTTLLLTLIPPLWKQIMQPRLAHWDKTYATPRERELLQRLD